MTATENATECQIWSLTGARPPATASPGNPQQERLRQTLSLPNPKRKQDRLLVQGLRFCQPERILREKLQRKFAAEQELGQGGRLASPSTPAASVLRTDAAAVGEEPLYLVGALNAGDSGPGYLALWELQNGRSSSLLSEIDFSLAHSVSFLESFPSATTSVTTEQTIDTDRWEVQSPAVSDGREVRPDRDSGNFS